MVFDSPQSVSRRSFMRILGVASAATTLPAFAAIQSGAPAEKQHSAHHGGADTAAAGKSRVLPPNAVILSANENPLGPSQSALTALYSTAQQGGRYHREEFAKTLAVFNDIYGLKRTYTAIYPGSCLPIDMALLSNIGPDKPLIYGDPSYEQGPAAALRAKAPHFAIPLTATHAHDVKAMVKAHPSAGAYYIVNPNNPTGTITPREDIVWLLKNKPAGSVVVVDEAYLHFSKEDSVLDLVAKDEDLIVVHTFSKIYGMAGIRVGVVAARPDLMEKFAKISPPGRTPLVSIASAAAARSSLLDKDLIPQRRKINTDIREETIEFLSKRGHQVLAGSQANMFMVDVKRPGGEFQQAMLNENVAIGRTWAAMPTYVRVTVGTKEEMAKFQAAFIKCIDIAPGSVAHSVPRNPIFQLPTELYRMS